MQGQLHGAVHWAVCAHQLILHPPLLEGLIGELLRVVRLNLVVATHATTTHLYARRQALSGGEGERGGEERQPHRRRQLRLDGAVRRPNSRPSSLSAGARLMTPYLQIIFCWYSPFKRYILV